MRLTFRVVPFTIWGCALASLLLLTITSGREFWNWVRRPRAEFNNPGAAREAKLDELAAISADWGHGRDGGKTIHYAGMSADVDAAVDQLQFCRTAGKALAAADELAAPKDRAAAYAKLVEQWRGAAAVDTEVFRLVQSREVLWKAVAASNVATSEAVSAVSRGAYDIAQKKCEEQRALTANVVSTANAAEFAHDMEIIKQIELAADAEIPLGKRLQEANRRLQSGLGEEGSEIIRKAILRWVEGAVAPMAYLVDLDATLGETVAVKEQRIIVGEYKSVPAQENVYVCTLLLPAPGNPGKLQATEFRITTEANSQLRVVDAAPREPFIKSAVDRYNVAARHMHDNLHNLEAWRVFSGVCESLEAEASRYRNLARRDEGVFPAEYKQAYETISFQQQAKDSASVIRHFPLIQPVLEGETHN